MKVEARYEQKNTDPFSTKPGDTMYAIATNKAEVPDETTMEELEKLAREATPEGYEFIKVTKVDEGKEGGIPCEIHGNRKCKSPCCTAAGEGEIISNPNLVKSCGQLYR